jgi:hypothetical protein
MGLFMGLLVRLWVWLFSGMTPRSSRVRGLLLDRGSGEVWPGV